ncbi:carbohydrate sulfotransferase 11 [Musca autumnalis]|uniref:carbohydrate sulfotransferase 11 n=1 Tax=Musca autumnalis TaxID=221902 RepID=UPI003CE970B5
MIIRLCYGRRLQTSLKLVACALTALFYFGFLFRESMHAFEQNKDKAEAAAVAVGLIQPPAKGEIKNAPSLFKRFLKESPLGNKTNLATLSSVSSAGSYTSSSTLNPVYEYSEEIHSATENDLKERRQHLHQICEKYNLYSFYPPMPKEFFISPGHNLVWCNVFKAASSTWMYYFNILGGYDPKYLQKVETPPIELARQRFPRPYLQDLLDSLPSSLSFLFARDPFERIVSGYRNKLEGGKNSYYKWLANRIIKRFRKQPMTAVKPKGPTFNEFVQYLIEQHANEKVFNEHWAPIYNFCTPCSINFTIIGKVETFNRDSEYIIRQAGLESLLLGKLPKSALKRIGNLSKGAKTHNSLEKYFSEIKRSTLDQLIDIYKLDFELFDYNYTKYYDFVIPDEIENEEKPSLSATLGPRNDKSLSHH